METIREIIISVTAVALICGIVTKLIHKGLLGSVMKLLAGIFMALSVVSPLLDLRLGDLKDFTLDIQTNAAQIAAEGENSARLEIAAIISEQSAAYILDKAESLGVELTVQVTVSHEDWPVPSGVRLEGSVSPYAKAVLSEYISETLGIEREEQQWIS